MHEVTCYHCGHIVHITPDAERCSVCGEDLRHLIPPEYASDYFYERANRLAIDSDSASALAEVERGLEYVNTPELRLLGAILAKRLQLFDRMRHHVAMIPVDDALRTEAEWLVRSHQDRQRAQRELKKDLRAASETTVKIAEPAPDDEELLDLPEFLREKTPPPPKRRSNRLAIGMAAISLLALVFVGWFYLGRGGSVIDGLFQAGSASATPLPSPELQVEPATTESDPNAVDPATNPALAPVEAPPIAPTATPPSDLVQSPSESPELAQGDPGSGVLQEADIFDLKSYLVAGGFTRLIDLEVEARIEGERLTIRGFVPRADLRGELVEVARQIPGVSEVNDLGLLLRTPPTYVVEEGDTLWNIVFKLYGDVNRLNEFYRANADILPSADASTLAWC
ncbi:MAG: hypothetical protein HC802_01530 [Caldilineaceae bacterium]|nr:hypothetical protein [Caldilineaceae bacterium]